MLTAQQIFWSIAIVSSVLLVILLVMTLFSTEEEQENARGNHSSVPPRLDPRVILLFTTLVGWFLLVGFYLGFPLKQNLLYSIILGSILVFAPILLSSIRKAPDLGINLLDLKGTILSTGQVLQSIPPNSNGLGKVQLHNRQAKLGIDAITTGQEIQPGAPVRVVDVIDNRILVVEPLYTDLPPDGGMIRNNQDGLS